MTFTFMFLYLYPYNMCLFFRWLILCVCLHVLMYVSVFAAVMANKVHHTAKAVPSDNSTDRTKTDI